MSGLRRDLMSAFTVLAVVMMVASVFPYAGLRFRAAPQAPRQASAAFVTLMDAEEAEALRVAKTSWQVDPSGLRRLRISLLADELPEDPRGPVEPRPGTGLRAVSEIFHPEPAAFPATRGAPPPRQIASEPPAPRELPFPKSELLKID